MSGSERIRRWLAASEGPARIAAFLVLVMGGAALVTGTRGGVVSLIAALLVMMGLGATGPAGRARGRSIVMATGLVILAGIWIGGDILHGTFEHLAEEIGQPETSFRLRLWGDAAVLWRQAPILGTGLGTFETALPPFRTLPAPYAFTHAESDWVQLLTDTGLEGALLILATLVTLLMALLRRLRHAELPWDRSFALAGVVVLVGIALHAAGNFNLVVLALPVYTATATAVALTASPGSTTRAAGEGAPGITPDACPLLSTRRWPAPRRTARSRARSRRA